MGATADVAHVCMMAPRVGAAVVVEEPTYISRRALLTTPPGGGEGDLHSGLKTKY